MSAKLFSRHVGAERVRGGVYWSHHEGGFVSVPPDGGELPGQPSDAFTRVPILVVLIAGPILGTAFAIFLPAAAFFGLAQLILRRLLPSRRQAAASEEARAEYAEVGRDAAVDMQR